MNQRSQQIKSLSMRHDRDLLSYYDQLIDELNKDKFKAIKKAFIYLGLASSILVTLLINL